MVELYALQAIVEPLAELGATLVAISPQLTTHSREVVEQHKLGFDILRDAGNTYAAELGVRFELPLELNL